MDVQRRLKILNINESKQNNDIHYRFSVYSGFDVVAVVSYFAATII